LTPAAQAGNGVPDKLLSAMRKEFGGHDEKKK
jgi:6-phosphogluconate dehydrogenase (decarboxylating)